MLMASIALDLGEKKTGYTQGRNTNEKIVSLMNPVVTQDP
jgi:hypothetical protein